MCIGPQATRYYDTDDAIQKIVDQLVGVSPSIGEDSNAVSLVVLSSLVWGRRQRGPVARHDDLPLHRTDGAKMG